MYHLAAQWQRTNQSQSCRQDTAACLNLHGFYAKLAAFKGTMQWKEHYSAARHQMMTDDDRLYCAAPAGGHLRHYCVSNACAIH